MRLVRTDLLGSVGIPMRTLLPLSVLDGAEYDKDGLGKLVEAIGDDESVILVSYRQSKGKCYYGSRRPGRNIELERLGHSDVISYGST
jgi:hypothetical protein